MIFFLFGSLSIRYISFLFYFISIRCSETIPVSSSEKPAENPVHNFFPNRPAVDTRNQLNYNHKSYWPLQWYMNEEEILVGNSVYAPSMKIAEMHKAGIRGTNIGVVIIGNTPVNCQVEEIRDRCRAESSNFSWYPKKSICAYINKKYQIGSTNLMSTAAAGIIAMTDQGQSQGVGIAPRCLLGNIVIEPSSRCGSPEACAAKITAHQHQNEPSGEVFVHAWNLSYHDYRSGILHVLGKRELLNFHRDRVRKPHVMGSGDLGVLASSCQCNEYANTDSMFVFGSIAYNGYVTSYSETCASLIGVTYSTSEGNEFYNNILTISPTSHNTPMYAPKGTTAVSAAIGGGIIVLIFDMFRQKHQRAPTISEIAFLLAFSSNSDSLQNKNSLWFTNGVGLKYSPQAGFGLPNLLNIYHLVQQWSPIELPLVLKFSLFENFIKYKCRHDDLPRTLTYMNNFICDFYLPYDYSGYFVQSVSVELSMKLFKRGALSVYLISSLGTVSCILEGRPFDFNRKDYSKLYIRTNHFMGEQLGIRWSIRFYTYKEDSKPTSQQTYSFPTAYTSTLPPSSHANNAHEAPPPNPSTTEFASSPMSGYHPNPTPATQISAYSPANLPPRHSTNTFNKSKMLKANLLYKVDFRFVLIQKLPPILNAVQRPKDEMKSKADFELLKAWVDFRNFLLVQTDPHNFGTNSVALWEVNDIMNFYVRKLTIAQRKPGFQLLNGNDFLSLERDESTKHQENLPNHPPSSVSHIPNDSSRKQPLIPAPPSPHPSAEGGKIQPLPSESSKPTPL